MTVHSPFRKRGDAVIADPGYPLTEASRGAEPPGLGSKPFRSLGLTADLSGRMFNSGLTIRRDNGLPWPYLAERLPELNTATWEVNADGTMETTYPLKANLTWHDGRPLTADDFVFSYEVYSAPAFGLASSPPINLMERVTAPDPRTVVIQWKRTFPDADALVMGSGGIVAHYASF